LIYYFKNVVSLCFAALHPLGSVTAFIQNNGIQESIGFANLSAILGANGHETDPMNRRVAEQRILHR